MPENYIDRIVRAKLSSLEVSLKTADWEVMLEKLNNSFYQIVKDKLQSLELPMETEDWNVLATELDQVFDQHIFQYLNDLSIPFESKDWPLFAAKLDGHPLDEAISQTLHDFRLPVSHEDWQAFEYQLDQDPFITDIRQQLQDVSVPYVPSDWNMFEAQMDQTFDQEIRQKLDGFELEAHPQDWTLMVGMLDGNSFDESVRESLARYTMPLYGGDWDEMAAQLEAPFDAEVKSKLDGMILSPQSGDWKAMARMIATEEDRTPVLWQWRTYATAAAAALILLFSGVGIQEGWFLPKKSLKNDILITQENSSSTSPTPQASVNDKQGSTNASSNDLIASDVDVPPPTQTKNPAIAHPSESSSGVFTALPAIEVSPVQVNPLEFANNSVDRGDIPQSVNLPGLLEEEPVMPGSAIVQRIDRMSPRGFGYTDFAQPVFQERGLDLFDPMLRNSRPEVRIGLYGATVRTKAQLNDQVDSIGFSTGLRVHMKIKNGWHLVTGFLYGKKTFSHVYPINEEGFRGSSGKTYGDFTVLEIPILARYEFPDIHGFTIYGQAGMVMAMNLEETYANLDPRSPVNASLVTRRLDPDMLASETHSWSLKTNPGNIHAAIGLRYAVTSQLSFELEPYFQQSLHRFSGSTSHEDRKKLYNSGIGATLIYSFPTDSKK